MWPVWATIDEMGKGTPLVDILAGYLVVGVMFLFLASGAMSLPGGKP